jgi:hypothetical protein
LRSSGPRCHRSVRCDDAAFFVDMLGNKTWRAIPGCPTRVTAAKFRIALPMDLAICLMSASIAATAVITAVRAAIRPCIPVDRNPLARRVAKPTVRSPSLPPSSFRLRQRWSVRSPTLKKSSAASAWSAPPIPSGGEGSETPPCAHPERLPSSASNPSKRARPTGQIVRYRNRTYCCR